MLYYLVQRRWRLFASAVTFTELLVLLAVLWLQVRGVTWAHDCFRNVKVLTAANKIDDFISANPIRFLLINLQVLIYSFTRSATSASIFAVATGALLILVWMFLTLTTTGKNAEGLSLATISVIGLLPLYHRLYDASLLAIPICWCMSQINGEMKALARVALITMIRSSCRVPLCCNNLPGMDGFRPLGCLLYGGRVWLCLTRYGFF